MDLDWVVSAVWCQSTAPLWGIWVGRASSESRSLVRWHLDDKEWTHQWLLGASPEYRKARSMVRP